MTDVLGYSDFSVWGDAADPIEAARKIAHRSLSEEIAKPLLPFVCAATSAADVENRVALSQTNVLALIKQHEASFDRSEMEAARKQMLAFLNDQGTAAVEQKRRAQAAARTAHALKSQRADQVAARLSKQADLGDHSDPKWTNEPVQVGDKVVAANPGGNEATGTVTNTQGRYPGTIEVTWTREIGPGFRDDTGIPAFDQKVYPGSFALWHKVDSKTSSKQASASQKSIFTIKGHEDYLPQETVAQVITPTIAKMTPGSIEIEINGNGYTVYYDQQGALGDDGTPVYGDLTGDYEVFRGVDGPVGLKDISGNRVHVSPYSRSNTRPRDYAANQIALAITRNLAQHWGPKTSARSRTAARQVVAGDTAQVMAYPICDICKSQGETSTLAAYDGKTVMGPWAYMCTSHFNALGVGLGTGQGQKLELAPSSKTSGKTSDYQEPAAANGFSEGEPVETEWGPGQVLASTGRSVTILLENGGGTINIQNGTPGMSRLQAMNKVSAKTAGAWDHYRKCDYCDKDIERRDGVYVHTETGQAQGPARGQFPPHDARPQSPPSWEMQMSTSLHTAGPGQVIQWYKNKHTDKRVGLVDAGMRADQVYAPAADHPDVYSLVKGGVDGRDGTSFNPDDWTEQDRQSASDLSKTKTSALAALRVQAEGEAGMVECQRGHNEGPEPTFHPAYYSHEGRFGEGPIYAVVCDKDYLTDYYTGEVLLPNDPAKSGWGASAADLGIEHTSSKVAAGATCDYDSGSMYGNTNRCGKPATHVVHYHNGTSGPLSSNSCDDHLGSFRGRAFPGLDSVEKIGAKTALVLDVAGEPINPGAEVEIDMGSRDADYGYVAEVTSDGDVLVGLDEYGSAQYFDPSRLLVIGVKQVRLSAIEAFKAEAAFFHEPKSDAQQPHPGMNADADQLKVIRDQQRANTERSEPKPTPINKMLTPPLDDSLDNAPQAPKTSAIEALKSEAAVTGPLDRSTMWTLLLHYWPGFGQMTNAESSVITDDLMRGWADADYTDMAAYVRDEVEARTSGKDPRREASRRQALNEDAVGAARYQAIPMPPVPDWLSEEWGPDGLVSPEDTTRGLHAAPPPPNPFADTLTTVRQAALRMMAAGGWLEVAQRVLADHQAEEVEGTLLDAQTAQVLLQVYEALSEENKPKFAAMPVAKAGKFAWSRVSALSKQAASGAWEQFSTGRGSGWRYVLGGKTLYEVTPTNGRRGSWDVMEAQPGGSLEWVGETFSSPEEAKGWAVHENWSPPSWVTSGRKQSGLMDYFDVVVLRRGDEVSMREYGTPDLMGAISKAKEIWGDGGDVVTCSVMNRGTDTVFWVNGNNTADGRLYGASRKQAGEGGTVPMTTKPRVIPGAQAQPNMVTLETEIVPPDAGAALVPDLATQPATGADQMGAGGSFDMGYAPQVDPLIPTVDQQVAAKIAAVASRIRVDNPTMSHEESRRLAAKTVATHPEMVKVGAAASGICPVCYRENIALKNGKLVAHKDTTRAGAPRCEGSGKTA